MDKLTKEEREMCMRSPVYLYNKYLKKPGAPDITQKEYDELKNSTRLVRTRKGTRLMTDKEYYELIDDTE